MVNFKCDDQYLKDMDEYTEKIYKKYGTASHTAEREIMIMAQNGNRVAKKMYADMIFYKRILRKNAYRESFGLYLEAADVRIDTDGNWSFGAGAYPLSYWMIAFCLVNYRRGSFIKDCEEISVIERMQTGERMALSVELLCCALSYVTIPGALNLIGRILYEAGNDTELFDILKHTFSKCIEGKDYAGVYVKEGALGSINGCCDASELFYKEAAKEGYVYASNNLALKEADRIITLAETSDKDAVKEAVDSYVGYLKLSADRFEPYAANRLGLFYMTGEVICNNGRIVLKEYIDRSTAREYFGKATVYLTPDSAWAFYNLIKYFHTEYDNNIELMNEHMDYIKELNPTVYNIAMEL
ncbi:MAG: hypothetical protein K6E53_02230 [Lachnospiraceae bacterium]|nr:hypothetical protein [Lachnospiraceae bacterium]